MEAPEKTEYPIQTRNQLNVSACLTKGKIEKPDPLDLPKRLHVQEGRTTQVASFLRPIRGRNPRPDRLIPTASRNNPTRHFRIGQRRVNHTPTSPVGHPIQPAMCCKRPAQPEHGRDLDGCDMRLKPHRSYCQGFMRRRRPVSLAAGSTAAAPKPAPPTPSWPEL